MFAARTGDSKLMNNINSSLKTAVIFLDLRKAFDCLNYECLIQQLSRIGIRGKILNLIKNYLSNRKQFVRVNGMNSESLNITCGAAQGGVLSPLLFLVYINNIFFLPLEGTIQCYADDTCLTYSNKTFSGLKQSMTNDLKIITNYLYDINLVINTKKTKFIIFKTRNQNLSEEFTHITINNETVELVKSYNYLGLLIDEKMNWNEHV